MLGPHELATLMVIKSASDQIDLAQDEVDGLLERQLIALEEIGSGVRRACLTLDDNSMLRAIAGKY